MEIFFKLESSGFFMERGSWILAAAVAAVIVLVFVFMPGPQPAPMPVSASPSPAAAAATPTAPAPTPVSTPVVQEFDAEKARLLLSAVNDSVQFISRRISVLSANWSGLSAAEKNKSLHELCRHFELANPSVLALSRELNSSDSEEFQTLAVEWASYSERMTRICADVLKFEAAPADAIWFQSKELAGLTARLASDEDEMFENFKQVNDEAVNRLEKTDDLISAHKREVERQRVNQMALEIEDTSFSFTEKKVLANTLINLRNLDRQKELIPLLKVRLEKSAYSDNFDVRLNNQINYPIAPGVDSTVVLTIKRISNPSPVVPGATFTIKGEVIAVNTADVSKQVNESFEIHLTFCPAQGCP
ncbi:MAG: hypothetical protein NTY90_00015 [Candidatus Micrarchaeota archaeon]|nr:hypothetical protein [Candidatus Micrarchaeota archaeon]